MLKPIPQENPSENQPRQKNNGRKQMQKNKQKIKSANFIRLEMKIRELEKTDKNLFMSAGKQLIEYIKKAESITLKELNELIHSMQRTMIALQNKRIKLIRDLQQKEQKKKKKN